MSSRLQAFVEAVKADLDPLVTVTYPTGVEMVVDQGARDSRRHQDTPRVAWRYESGDGESARGYKATTGNAKRPLWLRSVTVSARIWESNVERAENLLEAVARSVWHVAHGSVRFDGESWAEPGNVTRGEEVTAQFSNLLLPITDTAEPTVVVTATTHAVALDGSDEDCGHAP